MAPEEPHQSTTTGSDMAFIAEVVGFDLERENDEERPFTIGRGDPGPEMEVHPRTGKIYEGDQPRNMLIKEYERAERIRATAIERISPRKRL